MMESDDKFFPIQTKTACQLKWAWSTIFLNTGTTRSCHRTAESILNEKNFANFHNTPVKLLDRKKMLQGEWPKKNCGYCKKIEDSGGASDRIRMSQIPNLSPPELEFNKNSININPTIVEVYFSNACQMSCLYCGPSLSSSIESENKKFGVFIKNGVILQNPQNNFKNLVPFFWKWFELNFQKLKRLHVLGGEPLYQKEFEKLIEMIEKYPNPDCELNIVTNLMVTKERLEYFIGKFRKLLLKKLIKRIDITCSIDCWGPEQEYVRHGIDLVHWEKNFKVLMENRWLKLNINQTISVLTIKSMPALLEKLNHWRRSHKIGHFFGGVEPGPAYLKGEIVGGNFFIDDSKKILSLMPELNDEDKQAKNYMFGILNQINLARTNKEQLKNLKIFLDEKDRRRHTNWKNLFPWLEKFF